MLDSKMQRKSFPPYVRYIQRGKFEIDPDKQGIDALVHFDYMGSSEFEWGALPKSLKRIRDTIQKYYGKKFIIKGLEEKTIFCWFPDTIKAEEIQSILERLSKNTI